ncbi:pseudaminic acid synthase [Candidatus Pelagibacter sp.]|nr:pseudaminic acid synthase [Candidatus Pelagibacter sp.]
MKNFKFSKIKSPILIAEISANHNGSLAHAKKLIKTAKLNKADFVKLQTYEARNMTIESNRNEFIIKKGLWKNYTLWDLYSRACTPLNWQKELFSYSRKIGINCLSSPFDDECVDLLEKINCPIYKLASFEMTDIPLVKKIAQTKKPIIISTGLSSIGEIEKTVNIARTNGAKEIALLYCVSSYPAKMSDFNLNNITILKNKFKKCTIGLSDHSLNDDVAKIAISLGAKIIEKHIALDDQKKGLDIEFSIKGKEILLFKKMIENTYKTLGKNYFYRNKNEKKNIIYRRSIYSIKNISQNEIFTHDNIKRIRPYNGLSPEKYDFIIGKKAKNKILSGCPIKISHIKK